MRKTSQQYTAHIGRYEKNKITTENKRNKSIKRNNKENISQNRQSHYKRTEIGRYDMMEKESKVKWNGRQRMNDNRLLKICMNGKPQVRKSRGRPPKQEHRNYQRLNTTQKR